MTSARHGPRHGENFGWGAIFDWDGVVIDSSAAHEESWERLARETGKALPAGHFKKGFGRKNQYIIPEILAWSKDAGEINRLSLRKETLYREIVKERGIRPLPGVKTWLQKLNEAGIPCVIGSSTIRMNIDTVLEIIGLSACFADIVSGDDVVHGKPDPEVFLIGARRIGRLPEFCVVFEDAHVGIEAAHRAGMKAVAVATTHPLEELGKADLAVKRLDELDLSRIQALFSHA